jgi:cation transport ATPase
VSRRRRIALEGMKHVVFLVVAVAGIAALASRAPQLGLWEIAGLLIGGAMLTVYVLTQWIPKADERRHTRTLGEVAVLLAVAAACILLLLVLVEGVRRGNPVTVLVAGLFLVTFVRIGRDLERARERGRKRGLG